MNPNLLTATIEIFHDAECGRQDTAEVLAGIALTEEITGRLEVINDQRLIKLSKPGAPAVRPERINWYEQAADINIALTQRPLVSEQYADWIPNGAAGMAASFSDGKKVAFINLNGLHYPRTTTAHELGHLFGLKNMGFPNRTGREHCELQDCIMYHEAIDTIVTKVKPLGRFQNFLVDHGFMGPQYERSLGPLATNFCAECSEDLHREGVFRALGKVGIHLPTAKP